VTVHQVDAAAGCFRPAETVTALEACGSETEKGTAYECVVSPADEPYVALRNTAESLQSSTWRFGSDVSMDEQALCDAALEVGPPSPETICR
jgi:hypothetical protein